MSDNRHLIAIPRHPDDAHIPDSVVNIVLSPGRVVTITGPLFSKSMKTLHEVLIACKDSLVAKEDDFSI